MHENRIERAKALHRQGCNCAQAVTVAFADLYGMDEPTAMRVAASFGGGIGRMREMCGTAMAMFLLAGLATGNTDPTDTAAKNANVEAVQRLAARFKEENGSLVCAELLGLRPSPVPLKKKPCPLIVETAARIFAEFLEQTPPR